MPGLLGKVVEGVPEPALNAVVEAEGVVWAGGAGLHRGTAAGWELVDGVGRVNALAVDEGRGRVWYGGPDGMGFVGMRDGTVLRVGEVEGFFWGMRVVGDRVWYVTDGGYGWVGVEGEPGWHGERRFRPRPQMLGPWEGCERVFVACAEGLWELHEEGSSLVVRAETHHHRVIAWMVAVGKGFQMGTAGGVFQWSGVAGEEPEWVATAEPYFGRGISNGVSHGALVAVADFPGGVAVWDTRLGRFTGYAGEESGLRVGDVYKLGEGAEGKVFVLGTRGIGWIDLADRSRFFPAQGRWSAESRLRVVTHGRDLHLFSGSHRVHLSGEEVVAEPVARVPDWAAVDSEGRISYGRVNMQDRLESGHWRSYDLGQPLRSVWSDGKTHYAVLPGGVYRLTDQPALDRLLPTLEDYQLLGAADGALWVLSHQNRLRLIRERGPVWIEEEVAFGPEGEYRGAVLCGNTLVAAFGDKVHWVTPTSVKSQTLLSGWQVRGMAWDGLRVLVQLWSPARGQLALAAWEGTGPAGGAMLRLTRLPQTGDAMALALTEDRLALIGSSGVYLQDRRSLQWVSRPGGQVDLKVGGASAAGKRLPFGTESLRLELAGTDPAVPVGLAYRLNAGEWAVSAEGFHDLRVAGHGSFRVEARAVFPSGAVGRTQVLDFSVRPPWYLDPLVQALVFAASLAAVWVGFHLRSLGLRRANRWLNTEVKRKTRELEEATAARTNFLAGISHDIRNPLHGILLISDSLAQAPPSSAEDLRLTELRHLGLAVDQMLGEVLDFSSIDQNSIVLNLGPVGVAEILAGVVSQNQWALERAFINLTTRLPDELRETVIETDRSWLSQVLSNLLVNAIDYSQTERIELGVSLLGETDRSCQLQFFVKDWGIGIPEAERNLVFERFYRGESGIDSGRHGTGLGLAICRDVSRALGLELQLSENTPSGACFQLTGRFNKLAGHLLLDTEKVLAGLKGKSVLVVEDELVNQRAMVQFFCRRGCLVEACGNGHEAVALLETRHFDLALLDWDLPGLSGPQVARRVRRTIPGQDLLLIALTAYTDGAKRQESQRAGMDAFIAKPMTAQRLAEALVRCDGSWRRPAARPIDQIKSAQVDEAVNDHIDELRMFYQKQDWAGVRRVSHRLTTLAMILGNPEMQRICRDLQDHALAGDASAIQISLLGLAKWRTE